MANGENGRPFVNVDFVRLWIPFIVSLVTMLMTLGVLYGKLDGRLNLIEYRLSLIEMHLKP